MNTSEDTVSVELLRRELDKARALKSSGGSGTYDNMEARVIRLEDDMKEVRSDLKAIRFDLSEIKGKLSDMPTRSFVIGTVIAIVGLVLGTLAISPAVMNAVGN